MVLGALIIALIMVWRVCTMVLGALIITLVIALIMV